jgi:hypothetical protein
MASKWHGLSLFAPFLKDVVSIDVYGVFKFSTGIDVFERHKGYFWDDFFELTCLIKNTGELEEGGTYFHHEQGR